MDLRTRARLADFRSRGAVRQAESYLPARRAARIDPVRALRGE